MSIVPTGRRAEGEPNLSSSIDEAKMTMTKKTGMLDISLIVATRNRAILLGEMLDSLARQATTTVSWEVIVVDNGSQDDTKSVVDRASHALPIVYLYEPVPGQNRARNAALGIARGKLLVFTDDDVEFEPDWLCQLHKASQRFVKYNIFCGPIIPIYPDETPDWLRDHEFTSVAFNKFVYDVPEGPVPVLPFSANMAIRATAMDGMRFCEDIGPQGKNYAMGSETEFLLRLQERGERVVYVPSAIVKGVIEKHQLDIKWLLGRAFRYGRGNARLFPDQISRRLFGVPVYIWYRIPIAFLRYVMGTLRDIHQRFEWGYRFYFDCGVLFEYRQLAEQEKRHPR
jgi:glycosyltransferase involved in cell wall biosynthesis